MPLECRGIDVHTHMVPSSFPPSLRAMPPAGWPSMAPGPPCHCHVMIDGAIYRTVSDRCWDPAKRLPDMDAMAVEVQAVSPMPELLSYWLDPADARGLVRHLNEQIAGMLARAGGRMVGLGAVVLQDVELAIEGLRELMAHPGFCGVEIGSNINGRPIGAPEFLPFFACAEELGAAVFVHALRPARERLVGPKQLAQALGYPSDVGLAAASALTSDLILRHPRLRIGFSHGGGTLASLLPRLEQAHATFAPLREAMALSPTAQARRLFYDALVFDAPTLRHITALFGEDSIMLGSDYPFAFADKEPVARMAAAFGGDDAATAGLREKLLCGNAAAFLGLEGAQAIRQGAAQEAMGRGAA